MSETLEQQAVEAGIDLGYHDINGTYHATKPEVLESIVAVLDKSKPDSDGLYLQGRLKFLFLFIKDKPCV